MPDTTPDAIRAIERPDRTVYTVFLLQALLACVTTCGLALPVVLLVMVPTFIRYATTRYKIDEVGVAVSWGWLGRQESHLTFDKIQDIHLNRSLVERWLGLGTVSIETASANNGAEATLFGLTAYEEVRDYLYGHMRARQRGRTASDGAGSDPGMPPGTDDAEVVELLRDLRDEVRALRAGLSR